MAECRPSADILVFIREAFEMRGLTFTDIAGQAGGASSASAATRSSRGEDPHRPVRGAGGRRRRRADVPLARGSPAPGGFTLEPLRKPVRKWCRRLVVRPAKPLTASLSPVVVLRDLFQLEGVQARSRYSVDNTDDGVGASGALTLILIAHTWPPTSCECWARTSLPA